MINKLKSLKNHKGFMKYFKNTSWLFGEKILRMIVGLFVGIWVARYLGPEQFGLLSYAQSLVGLFAPIATFGLGGIVIRELVKNESKRDYLLGVAFWLKLFGAFVVLLILAIVINFTSNDAYTNTLVFIIASATIFQSFNVIDFYFQSKVLSKYVVYANIITLCISSFVKIILILYEASLEAFAWVILFDSFILAYGFVYFYIKNNLSIKQWKFDKMIALGLVKEGWPLILVGIASMINMRIDQVMLGNMTNNTVVGNYAVAVRLAEVWLVLPVLIGGSLYPAIISAKTRSESLYRKRIFKTMKYMSLFAIPFALSVSLFSDEIINILYGKQYSSASIYLALYIWTGIPYIIFFVFNQVFLIEKLILWSLYITVFTVVVNISLNFILIPKYGGIGAMITTIVVVYSSQVLSLMIIYIKTNIFQRTAIV